MPDVDPDGLLEFSVVYTDRSLNHMSRRFQRVMQDISATLKEVYHARSVALVPGGGSYGMEAVARQFATGRKALVIRNGWFSYRWTQIFDAGSIPRRGASAEGTQAVGRAAGALAPLSDRRGGRHDPRVPPRRGVRAPCRDSAGMMLPDDYLRRWPTRSTRPAACSCSTASPPARCGRHAGLRRRRADQRTAEGLERIPRLRHGHAGRARPRRDRLDPEHQLRG